MITQRTVLDVAKEAAFRGYIDLPRSDTIALCRAVVALAEIVEERKGPLDYKMLLSDLDVGGYRVATNIIKRIIHATID